MSGANLTDFFLWLLLGCAAGAALLLLGRRPASAFERLRRVGAGQDTATAGLEQPTSALALTSSEPDFTNPLGYEERALLAERLTKRRPRLYWAAGYTAGPSQEGEADNGRLLGRVMEGLDDGWAIFYALRLPGEQEAIDMLLVGQGGVLALEVASEERGWRLENGEWLTQTGSGDWATAGVGPEARLLAQATQAETYLKQQGIETAVKPVLLLGYGVRLDRAVAGVEVWRAAEIGQHMAALREAEELPALHANQVVLVLEQELIDQAAALL